MRWRRARRGEGGAAASASCGKVKEVGRKLARWRMERCRRGEACKESGAGEVSSNSLVRVRVKVKVRERMGGGLVKLVFILGFFF